MNLTSRAGIHAALGDQHRLLMIDRLRLGDHTTQELVDITGLAGNLLAHHLNVLEEAGLIERRVSEGDRRRRYVVLRRQPLANLLPRQPPPPSGSVLFICTHNSARSQFAAALWRQRTGAAAESAGSHPAAFVHPHAVRVAAEYGVDLTSAAPKGYTEVTHTPDLVVSVCDRAREGGIDLPANRLHWSIPDPVRVGKVSAFRQAFSNIAVRIEELSDARKESS